MNNLYWKDNIISVITHNIEAKPHSHLMLQLFINSNSEINIEIDNQIIKGNYILIDSNVKHSIKASENLECFVLFDVTSSIAKQLKNNFLKNNKFVILPIENSTYTYEFIKTPSDISNELFIKNLLEDLNITYQKNVEYDERILDIIKSIENNELSDYDINNLSKKYHLSTSRLSHLFFEQTGISLKSFILLYQLKKVYKLLSSGKNITESAMEAGFYSSSHLADVNRKMMGMSISKFIK